MNNYPRTATLPQMEKSCFANGIEIKQAEKPSENSSITQIWTGPAKPVKLILKVQLALYSGEATLVDTLSEEKRKRRLGRYPFYRLPRSIEDG